MVGGAVADAARPHVTVLRFGKHALPVMLQAEAAIPVFKESDATGMRPA